MTMITSIDISTYMITFFFSMSKEDQLSSLRHLQTVGVGMGLISRIEPNISSVYSIIKLFTPRINFH